jgi:hypothetical protein
MTGSLAVIHAPVTEDALDVEKLAAGLWIADPLASGERWGRSESLGQPFLERDEAALLDLHLRFALELLSRLRVAGDAAVEAADLFLQACPLPLALGADRRLVIEREHVEAAERPAGEFELSFGAARSFEYELVAA